MNGPPFGGKTIRITRSILCLAGLIAAVALTGCSASRPVSYEVGSPALLFGRSPSPYDATRFTRGPWPATTNGYDTVERRNYVEYYRDYQGNANNERNTPYRFFRSYSSGSQLR
ncbi:MAG TPA: hypothetical protein P5081_15000 [Phycisphaerae bacterium]|nr:hypothetical protein [Phycisphaerae bacterium]HRW54177.1 hypothetical protein [Phycisphaerae bacterium]